MKRKSTLIASAAAAALVAAPAWAARDVHAIHHAVEGASPTQLAQAAAPGTGRGMGPGMMGQGQGQGQGQGPGMMGGYGSGGYGMGPGMMGGYGMGPGMMGGYGIGPGMMGGYGSGGYGMGPGMMGGAGPYAGLDLSSEQRSKIADIQQALWRKQWDLMGKMHEGRFHMQQYGGAETDDSAVRKAYQAMADAHKQMFEATLDARKRIDAVLTKEQREKLKGGGRGG